MKKRLLVLLLTVALTLTLWPTTISATSFVIEVGGVGSAYDLTEAGLKDAISDAIDGDTIKFMDSGTITLTSDLVLDKSITLDLNSKTINFTIEFNRFYEV